MLSIMFEFHRIVTLAFHRIPNYGQTESLLQDVIRLSRWGIQREFRHSTSDNIPIGLQ